VGRKSADDEVPRSDAGHQLTDVSRQPGDGRSFRISAYAEKIRRRIFRACEIDVRVNEFPKLDVLTVESPDAATISAIRDLIEKTCEEDESINGDFGIFVIDDSIEVAGAP
jgi:hypothetical protein